MEIATVGVIHGENRMNFTIPLPLNAFCISSARSSPSTMVGTQGSHSKYKCIPQCIVETVVLKKRYKVVKKSKLYVGDI